MRKTPLLHAQAEMLRGVGSPLFRSLSFDSSRPPGHVVDEWGVGSCNIGIMGLLCLIDACPYATDEQIEQILDPGSAMAFRDWLDLFEYIVTHTVPREDRPDLRARLAIEYRANEANYLSLGLNPPNFG